MALEKGDLEQIGEMIRNASPSTIIGRPSWRAFLIACLICALVGLAGGVAIDHMWNVSDLRAALAGTRAELAAEKAKPPVKVPVEVKGAMTNTIQYVDRPVYIDPATGKRSEDPADLVATSGGKSTFTMALIGANGKRQDFPFNKTAKERYVFDKNRLEWVQDFNFSGTIDARDMMEEYARARIEAARPRGGVSVDLVNRGVIAGVALMPTKKFGIHVTGGIIDGSPVYGGGVQWLH